MKKAACSFITILLFIVIFSFQNGNDRISVSSSDKLVYDGARVYSLYSNDESTDSGNFFKSDVITIELIIEDYYFGYDISTIQEQYSSFNKSFIDHYQLEQFGRVIHSDYAPFIKVILDDINGSVGLIYSLMDDSNVRFLFWGSDIISNLDIDNNLYYSSGDDIVFDDGGGGGSSTKSNVKVGIIDGGNIDTNVSNRFSGVTIVEKDPTMPNHSHTSAIADIIVNDYADNSNLELYTSYVVQENVADIYSAVDWQITQGIDVINMSAGTNCTSDLGSYDSVARYVDYIVKKYGITFVAAAGNRDTGACTHYFDDAYVVSPAIGFNVIAVGAITSTNSIWGLSCYIENSLGISKPNLVTIYSNYVNGGVGTSYSTPRVTAVVAKMMSTNPHLKGDPGLVMSILHASSNPDIVIGDSSDTDLRGFKNKIGSGKLDYPAANYVSSVENYKVYTNSFNYDVGKVFLTSKSFYISNSSTLTVSFSNLVDITKNGDTYSSNGYTEYIIELYEGSVKVKSITVDRNYAILRHSTTSNMIQYTIKVYQNSPFPSGVSIEKISIAYFSRVY